MKIAILAHDNGEYNAYVGYFDDPVKLQYAVDKLNAERLDTYSLESPAAEVIVMDVESIPMTIDDAFLDRLASMLDDTGMDIERTKDRLERLKVEAEEMDEETEAVAEPPSPGQMELE